MEVEKLENGYVLVRDQNDLKLLKKIGKGIGKAVKSVVSIKPGKSSGAMGKLVDKAFSGTKAGADFVKKADSVSDGGMSKNLTKFKSIADTTEKIGSLAPLALTSGATIAVTPVLKKAIGNGSSTLGNLKLPSGSGGIKRVVGDIGGAIKESDISKDIVKEVLAAEVDKRFGTELDEPEEAKIGFNELRIFKPAMSLALKEKGITPSSKIETLSNQFYDNVVSKTPGNKNDADAYNTPKDIVVEAILKYFISTKSKKDSGGELTDLEKIIAAGYEQAQNSAKGVAEDGVKSSIGEWVYENKSVVAFAGLFVFVIIIALIAKK